MFATWGPKKSGTLVANSVLRDSRSGDDVVHDCSGEVCGDVVKDEGSKHRREMVRSVVDSRTSLSAARIKSMMWFLSADRPDTSFVAD